MKDNSRAVDEFSFCILWSPLPIITWIIPIIGHLGIADSRGVISDFQGSYYVGDRGRMAFGRPTRSLSFSMKVNDLPGMNYFCIHFIIFIIGHTSNFFLILYLICAILGGSFTWDEKVKEANQVYNGRVHNLFCDNCHSHVPLALNLMNMQAFGIENWDMVKLCFLVFFRARFLSFRGFLSQFAPFLILVFLIVLPLSLLK